MSDDSRLLRERLTSILEALERIPRRFAGINTPADFYATDAGIGTRFLTLRGR